MMTDAVPFLLECRRRGLVFVLADGGQLAAGPRHLIDPDLAAAIRDRKDALLAALRAEQPPAPPLAWPAERLAPRKRLAVAPEAPGELERLVALLGAAEWPAVPFLVNLATLVADPALAKRHLLTAAAADPPPGQVRRAVLARLRLLRRLADNGWRLT
jgi:hypothetical protein